MSAGEVHIKQVQNVALTWLPVSTQLKGVEVKVFQKRMHRSAVPPPLARRPCWYGDQAIAFTAAVCSWNRATGAAFRTLQMNSLLSLPPDASCCASNDHFRPHTSCLWPVRFPTVGSFARTSRRKMLRSRDPEAKVWAFQAKVPTRAACPLRVRTRSPFATSHSSTRPALVPTAKCVPRWVHAT